jgi:hypothetical protein
MRHGFRIYFLPSEVAKRLDWRGFCVSYGNIFFFLKAPGGLTEKTERTGGPDLGR